MLSPSLQGNERAAFELKFALTPELQPAAIAWARSNMIPDSHADSAGCYQVSTLYFDTPSLSMLIRERGFRTTKYRVRRYGAEDLTYFERKRKRGNRVRKVREAGSEPPTWFESERCARGLDPALWVTYQRHAFVGEDGLRLTMDGDLRAWRTEEPGTYDRPGPLVVELKFHDALPALFRTLIAELRLMPAACSKYRLSMAHFVEPKEAVCRIS